MTLFDRYIAVDWSANNRPKTGKDSIWLASLTTEATSPRTENPPTRHGAEARLLQELTDSFHRRDRVLIGFDFPYGYPRGFAAALGLDGVPWRSTWAYLAERVHDDKANASNRFEVAAEINRRLAHHAPFWGRPTQRDLESLAAKKDVSYLGPHEVGGLAEWREVEIRLRATRHQPHSVWKLLGAGAVGGQALLGIPTVHRLQTDPELQAVSRVWPFEVGVPNLLEGNAAVVHAEIWPSLADLSNQQGGCRDEKQVRTLTLEWRDLDHRGELAALFDAPPDDPAVRTEEGWVLGFPRPGEG